MRRASPNEESAGLDSLAVEIVLVVVSHLESAESLMVLRTTAKQFHQLCAEAAWSKLQTSPRIALRCVYGLPHLQQLALVQRAQTLADGWRDEEMPLEIAHCKEHGRCRQLRRGAVTRAQRRDNPGLADGGIKDIMITSPGNTDCDLSHELVYDLPPAVNGPTPRHQQLG